MTDQSWTGGCQCGAVRFRVTELGRATLCHCRMCQKASSGIGGLFVAARRFVWSRGTPKYFASSNVARRGFCGDCGTPLSFENDHGIDLSIVAFDRPSEIPPELQLAVEARISWMDGLSTLPLRPAEEVASTEARDANIISYQHPDYDVEAWTAPGRSIGKEGLS